MASSVGEWYGICLSMSFRCSQSAGIVGTARTVAGPMGLLTHALTTTMIMTDAAGSTRIVRRPVRDRNSMVNRELRLIKKNEKKRPLELDKARNPCYN